jgi:antitoxin ParD1/3/4
MSALRITLPQRQLQQLKKRAAQLGFSDVSAYLQSVVAQKLSEPVDEDYGAPEHLKVRSRQDLEAKLLAGEKSGPATEMTTRDWDELRDKVRRGAAVATTRAKAS